MVANIPNQVIAQISGQMYGVAGYYSDNDATQHVVVATHDGTLYEVHWNSSIAPTTPQRIGHFPGIHSLSGFFTDDDNFQHVIVATEDGRLHELYFTDPQHIHTRSPLFQLPTTSGPHIGMIGYYDCGSKFRTVMVGGADSVLYEVSWNAQYAPYLSDSINQFPLPDVAGIAGIFDCTVNPSEHTASISQNTIIAMKNRNFYNVHLDYVAPGGGKPVTDLVTTASAPLVNVAAFFIPDNHYKHVILLDANGQVSDYSFTSTQVFGTTPLITLNNVVDIAAYYSAYDDTNHVILITTDGKIHEVYYSLMR